MSHVEQKPEQKAATIYRMMMPTHTCPYGIKALDLLAREGYQVDDRHLATQEETEAFKSEHNVSTTPQIWLGEHRIGGYDALREHFGHSVKGEDETTYRPVIAIFAVAALMALSF